MDRRKNTSNAKASKSDCKGANNESGIKDSLISCDIGLDISTSTVGVVVLESDTGNLIKLDAIKLTGVKFVDHWDKAVCVENEFENLVDFTKFKVKNIFVEEAHMKFTPGFSSAGTLFSLARFNGIVSFIAYKVFNEKPTMVNVRTARKSLGIKINHKDKSKNTKTKIFETVKNINPTFPWRQHVAKTGKQKGKLVFDKQNEDMADAWVIASGGARLGKQGK